MPDNLFKTFGKVFDIRHSHFFCHFADGQCGRLQQDDCHVHLIIQHILMQGKSCILENQSAEIIFVVIELCRNLPVGERAVIMAVDIL